MTIANPIRLDLLQKALRDEIVACFGAPGPVVAWVRGQQLFEDTPAQGHVSLRVLAGPEVHTRRKGHGGRPFVPHADYTISVAPVTVGQVVWIEVNCLQFSTQVIGGDTQETVRDRLLAALPDDSPVFTATPSSTDAITLAPVSLGQIYSLRLSANLSISSFTAQTQAFQLYRAANVFTIQIQAFSKCREPRDGAVAMTSTIRAMLQDTNALFRLNGQGLGVWNVTTPLDISALAEGHWESRSTLDARIAISAAWASPVGEIDQTKTTFTPITP